MSKISIKNFSKREACIIWDKKNNKCRFITLETEKSQKQKSGYVKNHNYWKYLKTKLVKENNQLTSATCRLNFTINNSKKYLTSTFDSIIKEIGSI